MTRVYRSDGVECESVPPVDDLTSHRSQNSSWEGITGSSHQDRPKL